MILSNQNGGSTPLTAVYDRAITSQSYMRRISDQSWLIAPMNRLAAFVIEDEMTKRAHGVDGQLIAEMVVQAVYNYQISLNFESLASEREEPTQLSYPKDSK